MAPGPHAVVKRELLVRYLDAWTPAALHASRRATYMDGYASGESVQAALGVFGEFTDLLARRRLGVVLVGAEGDGVTDLTAEVAAVRARVPTPAGVAVQIVPRPPDGSLPAVAVPVGWPLLVYADAARAASPPETAQVAALLGGGRAEALVVLDAAALGDPEGVETHRRALRGADTGLVACVELVAGDRAELAFFVTPSAQRLEVFKDALWAVDEYAGVRYRDPRDPDRALLDISLSPHPGPLRRALLGHLREVGARTVADLRRYALTDTVYRGADVPRALTALVTSGDVHRDPPKGRLTADALITAA